MDEQTDDETEPADSENSVIEENQPPEVIVLSEENETDVSESEVALLEDESEGAENTESRPKRHSKVEFLIKGEEDKRTGIVRHVGKKSSNKKNVCWIDVEGEIHELDFLRDVTSWKYIERKKLTFDKTIQNSDKKTVKEDDEEGIFYMKRVEPITVYAAEVPKS